MSKDNSLIQQFFKFTFVQHKHATKCFVLQKLSHVYAFWYFNKSIIAYRVWLV